MVSNTNCVYNVTNYLNFLCYNSNNCILMADNTYFVDNCYGTYKYLNIKYRCIDSFNTTTPLPASNILVSNYTNIATNCKS